MQYQGNLQGLETQKRGQSAGPVAGTAGDAALKHKWVEKTPQPFSTLPAILRCLPLAETGEPRRYYQRCQHPSPCSKWSSVPFLPWRQNLHPLLGQDPAFCQSRCSRSREGVPGAQRWIISVRSGCYSGTRVASGGNNRVWFPRTLLEGSLTWRRWISPCGLRKKEAAEVTPSAREQTPPPHSPS